MERILLDTLSWRIKTPTSFTFLHLYTQAASTPEPGVTAMAAYLIELSMLDYDSLAYPPSMVAAAATLLAQSWTARGACPEDVALISGEQSPCTLTLQLTWNPALIRTSYWGIQARNVILGC